MVHRFRRLVALLLAVVLAQGTMLRSGASCAAERGTAAVSVAPETSAGHDHSAMHMPAPADEPASAHDHEPGEHTPAHCVMAMSCVTTALIVPNAPSVAQMLVAGGAIAALDDDLPPSTGGAPEPPPPRA